MVGDAGPDSIRVLYVDDEPTVAERVARSLERADDRLAVERAPTASEALDRLAAGSFDCVVSAAALSDRSGVALLEAVRETDERLPFLLYAADGSEALASEAISAGVTDYLRRDEDGDRHAALADRVTDAVAAVRDDRDTGRTREYYQTVLEYTADFVMIVDGAGTVEYVSPAVERVLGYAPGELTGTDAFEPIHPDDESVAADGFGAVLAEPGRDHTVEFRSRHDDGSWRWLEVRGRNCLADPVVEGVVVTVRDVTERRRREEELAAQRERYTDLFESVPQPVAHVEFVDDEPVVRNVNAAFEEVFGFDRSTLLGRSLDDAIVPADQRGEASTISRLARDGATVEREVRRLTADGERTFLFRVMRTETGEGTTEATGMFVDVTERVERQRELDHERRRFQSLAETAADAILVVEPDGTVVYANDAVERIFGYPPEAVEGDSLTSLMPARYRGDHLDAVARYVETGERRLDWEVVRFPGLHADGSEVPLELSFGTFEGADGMRFTAFVRDVSDRHALEADLRSEKELLERLFDTSPVGILVLDADGAIVRANDLAETVLGLRRSEIVSRTYEAAEWDAVDVDGEPIPTEELSFSRVMRTGEPVADQRQGITVDGERRWLSVTAAPLTDADGTIERVVSIVEDVTDRVERERELERYETIVETATEPIWLLDGEGRFARVNDALVAATGYDRERLLGSDVLLVSTDATAREMGDCVEDFRSGARDRASFEATLLTGDGSRVEYVVSMAPLHAGGDFEGAVVVAHEVTALREHERRLSVLDRVLRHNLANKLNVVLGHAEALAEVADATVAERATAIRDTADQLLRLSDSARQFESVIAGEPDLGTVDVAATVEDVVAEAEATHAAAELSTRLPDEAPARVSETVELALAELVENAIVHSDRAEPSVEVSVTVAASAVVVSVVDDGPGIDDVDRRALLRGEETPLEHTQGLGLWLVRWTVESVGGDIDIAENDPRGAVVSVSLPRARE